MKSTFTSQFPSAFSSSFDSGFYSPPMHTGASTAGITPGGPGIAPCPGVGAASSAYSTTQNAYWEPKAKPFSWTLPLLPPPATSVGGVGSATGGVVCAGGAGVALPSVACLPPAPPLTTTYDLMTTPIHPTTPIHLVTNTSTHATPDSAPAYSDVETILGRKNKTGLPTLVPSYHNYQYPDTILL